MIEDGKRQRSTQGSAQGAVLSPILANVYLHYVFDLWVNAWRGKRAKGQVIVIRYADDTLVGFQHKAKADQFLLQLKHRMQQFGLRLHAGKTKLLRFGRYAAAQCRALGQRKPPTLDFLGFTHYCTTARRMDWFVVGRKSQKTRLRRQLQALKQGLRQRLHASIHATGQWLERALQGHLNYYAVPGNGPSLTVLRQAGYRVLVAFTTPPQPAPSDELGTVSPLSGALCAADWYSPCTALTPL